MTDIYDLCLLVGIANKKIGILRGGRKCSYKELFASKINFLNVLEFDFQHFAWDISLCKI